MVCNRLGVGVEISDMLKHQKRRVWTLFIILNVLDIAVVSVLRL